MVRLCKANFGECYASWNHLKVLRLFIESVLRYGLPPDFQSILVYAKPGKQAQARKYLNKHYAYLDNSSVEEEEVGEDIQGLLEKDYSPVVLFALNTIY